MALRLDNVTFAYGRGAHTPVDAVAGVSLVLEPGELVLVLGPTGSGKSTLMRLAAGLLAPAQGSVSVDGAPAGPKTAGAKVGLIFQDPESQLFADTVLDDVAFGPRNLGLDRPAAQAAAKEALSAVGLNPEAFGPRSPFTLSGGEARRAAIAGVLAMRPRYLLADEPTAGLDARGRRAVCELLRSQRARSGVMVVSHAAEHFLADADRVVVLRGGAVAWSGTGDAVAADPDSVTASGVRLPDILEVQHALIRAGLSLPTLSLEPSVAAANIASAKRGS